MAERNELKKDLERALAETETGYGKLARAALDSITDPVKRGPLVSCLEQLSVQKGVLEFVLGRKGFLPVTLAAVEQLIEEKGTERRAGQDSVRKWCEVRRSTGHGIGGGG